MRVGGGKHNAHWSTLREAQECSTLRAGSVHDGPDVIHPVLYCGNRTRAVGQASPSLIEANQSAKGGESANESCKKRRLHLELKVRDEAGDEYEVEWTLAHDLIGHVVVAALCVSSLGYAAHWRALQMDR